MSFNYWQEFEPQSHYHIFNKSDGRKKLFKNRNDYQTFLERFENYLSPYFQLNAYCLIPNHYHFIVKVKSIDEILKAAGSDKTISSRKFLAGQLDLNSLLINEWRRFLSSFANYYKVKYNWEGAVFKKRFRRVIIKNDERLMRSIAYIHHNPIHHGLVKDYGKWPFCSFEDCISEIASIIAIKDTLIVFGSLEEFYRFHFEFKKNFEPRKRKTSAT